MIENKVYIAGAGPGGALLITEQLKMVLEAADVIFYDRLVSKEIFAYFPDNAEFIYAGKSNKEGGKKQKRINEMMIEKWHQKRGVIVRLNR